MSFSGVYQGRRVLVTGDTGFKGAWLTRWLKRLGAEVHGLALPPERATDLFPSARLSDDMTHEDGDIRDMELVSRCVAHTKPELVFHLAAQAVVRRGYSEPVETLATNVMGTAHVLEAIRRSNRPMSVVVVTSDKCYANEEADEGYTESSPLGGDDIYSASKGAAEVVTASFRRSFFDDDDRVRIASARAGNVIGPGDWADARLIPDAVQALSRGEHLKVRNPGHVRPWQHVLEPLSGYLWLGALLHSADGKGFTEAFNFGPEPESCIPVANAADLFVRHFEGIGWKATGDVQAFRETKLLRLNIEKAAHRLDWRPVWKVDEAIRRTARGYRALAAAIDATAVRAMMDAEIDAYVAAASAARLSWSRPTMPTITGKPLSVRP